MIVPEQSIPDRYGAAANPGRKAGTPHGRFSLVSRRVVIRRDPAGAAAYRTPSCRANFSVSAGDMRDTATIISGASVPEIVASSTFAVAAISSDTAMTQAAKISLGSRSPCFSQMLRMSARKRGAANGDHSWG